VAPNKIPCLTQFISDAFWWQSPPSALLVKLTPRDSHTTISDFDGLLSASMDMDIDRHQGANPEDDPLGDPVLSTKAARRAVRAVPAGENDGMELDHLSFESSFMPQQALFATVVPDVNGIVSPGSVQPPGALRNRTPFPPQSGGFAGMPPPSIHLLCDPPNWQAYMNGLREQEFYTISHSRLQPNGQNLRVDDDSHDSEMDDVVRRHRRNATESNRDNGSVLHL